MSSRRCREHCADSRGVETLDTIGLICAVVGGLGAAAVNRAGGGGGGGGEGRGVGGAAMCGRCEPQSICTRVRHWGRWVGACRGGTQLEHIIHSAGAPSAPPLPHTLTSPGLPHLLSSSGPPEKSVATNKSY